MQIFVMGGTGLIGGPLIDRLIQRGDRTWLVRIFLGRDPQSGTRRYHNHTVRGTKKDAQRYLNGVLREIDLGTVHVTLGPSAPGERNPPGDEQGNWMTAPVVERVRRRHICDGRDSATDEPLRSLRDRR